MKREELRTLVMRVISGNSDDDGVCEPEDAAADMLRIIDREVESRLKAMRAAMFPVNFDNTQQVLQAYERAIAKQHGEIGWHEIEDWSLLEIPDVDRNGDHWEPHVFVAAHGRVFEFHSWLFGAREAAQIAAALAKHCGPPKSPDDPVCPTNWGMKWRMTRDNASSSSSGRFALCSRSWSQVSTGAPDGPMSPLSPCSWRMAWL